MNSKSAGFLPYCGIGLNHNSLQVTSGSRRFFGFAKLNKYSSNRNLDVEMVKHNVLKIKKSRVGLNPAFAV
jgi:hypothetical protein